MKEQGPMNNRAIDVKGVALTGLRLEQSLYRCMPPSGRHYFGAHYVIPV